MRAERDRHVIVIPHREPPKAHRIRTAVYCRVSTKHEMQEDSLENQIRHYRETIGQDKNYDLVEIYQDFGISGFQEDRPGFRQMLRDAGNGAFDLIITKSVTRFARNTGIVLDTVQRLKNQGIGIYFELQKINTLEDSGELLLTLYAAFGQAESDASRTTTKMVIQRKVEKQEPIQQLHRVYGYTKNKDGAIVPDENAEAVREIFQMAADGFTLGEITEHMNRKGVRAKKGGPFSNATIYRMIRNEAYKGDFVQFRFYRDEHRKLRHNTGECDRIYYRENHTPVVSRDLWEQAQQGLDARKRQRRAKDPGSACHPAE